MDELISTNESKEIASLEDYYEDITSCGILIYISIIICYSNWSVFIRLNK